jgi:hypothetical protein
VLGEQGTSGRNCVNEVPNNLVRRASALFASVEARPAAENDGGRKRPQTAAKGSDYRRLRMKVRLRGCAATAGQTSLGPECSVSIAPSRRPGLDEARAKRERSLAGWTGRLSQLAHPGGVTEGAARFVTCAMLRSAGRPAWHGIQMAGVATVPAFDGARSGSVLL